MGLRNRGRPYPHLAFCELTAGTEGTGKPYPNRCFAAPIAALGPLQDAAFSALLLLAEA